jgi:hypothetical protein
VEADPLRRQAAIIHMAIIIYGDRCRGISSQLSGNRGSAGGLATLPYIAGSHPLAEKFVCCHFGDSFRHLPFVHGNSLANHFDGSFLIGFICKEIPHNSRSSLGIESRNPHVPTCCHLCTVYSPALTDLFNWRTPGLLLVVGFAHDRRFVGLVFVVFVLVIIIPIGWGLAAASCCQ